MRARFRIATRKVPLIIGAIVVVPVLLIVIAYAITLSTGQGNRTIAGGPPATAASASTTDTTSPPASVDANNTSSSDIEYLPLVPGAYGIKTEQRATRLWKGVEFKVQMGTEDILQFYKVQLPARGWIFKYENRNISYSPVQGYFWEDKQDRTPYVLMLYVTVDNNRSVSLSVDRIPILDKTPIYPGVQDVEKKQQAVPTTLPSLNKPGNDLPMIETIITYRAQATRQDVENYYKDTLTQYGWSYGGEAFDNSVNAYINGSLVFRWGIGGVDTVGVGASVTLLATETANGWTEVELHLAGTNKYSP